MPDVEQLSTSQGTAATEKRDVKVTTRTSHELIAANKTNQANPLEADVFKSEKAMATTPKDKTTKLDNQVLSTSNVVGESTVEVETSKERPDAFQPEGTRADVTKTQTEVTQQVSRATHLEGSLERTEDSLEGVPTIPMLNCLLYTSPSPRDRQKSRMPSSA